MLHTYSSKYICRIPGNTTVYLSADSVAPHEFTDYPTEFINNLNPPGCPIHRLVLKPNTPAILLRNINPKRGLSNGTRLICTTLEANIIEARIISGSHIGERVFLPRITLTPSDCGLPFAFKRKQFPIKVSKSK